MTVKEAVSKGRLRVAQTRQGRRPLKVSTYLRKEKDGSLYKAAFLGVDKAKERADEALQETAGLKVEDLGRARLLPTLARKAREGLGVVKPSAREIAEAHRERMEKGAAAPPHAPGKVEQKLPWYTTALGGTGGAMLGKTLAKKNPMLGTLAGTLVGTGLGLESGEALGRKIDKTAGSNAPASRLFLGSARGPEQSIESLEPKGFGAPAKVKPGDAPSRDSNTKAPPVEHNPTLRYMDSAQKVAEMGHLVPRPDTYPSRAPVVRQDPAGIHARRVSGYQHAGASQPGPDHNPNGPKTASQEPYRLSEQELLKFCEAYHGFVDELSQSKLASQDLEELHKEAILGALRKVVPKSKKIIQLGDETIDLRPKSNISYQGLGKKLEQTGNMFRAPKGVTPEMARQAGNVRAGSAGGRIAGEGLHSAGRHMQRAGTVGKVLNPIGKPVGGLFEGVARQSGKELQRAGGAVATGLKTPAATLGGGARGAVGRTLERRSRGIGLAGELGTAAGTATALGHAISPAAHGLALAAKKTGLYAPLKAHMGGFGFNFAKDVAATGAEGAATRGGALLRGLKGIATRGAQVAA